VSSVWVAVSVLVGAFLIVSALVLLVRMTHRLPVSEPLETHPGDLAAPLPLSLVRAGRGRRGRAVRRATVGEQRT
jgi:hypothetical protein